MQTYLVERYLPGRSAAAVRAALRRAHTACAQLTASGAPVLYQGSMFLPSEEACFCRFDAESPETVARANELAEVPFARITPALPLAPDDSGGALCSSRTQSPGGFDVHPS